MTLFRPEAASDDPWDRLCLLWEADKLEAPYRDLMVYEMDVNNGGHVQYFFNAALGGALEDTVQRMYDVLPEVLSENLRKAYACYRQAEERCPEPSISHIFSSELYGQMAPFDDVFSQYDAQIMDILCRYADQVSL